jgi:hypothetical protein
MNKTQCKTFQKDGNMLKFVIPKMTNMLGMLSFQWWHLIPCQAFVELVCLQGFIEENSNEGWIGG